MGVTRKLIKEGNGDRYPKKGDQVTIQYTGNLYDEAKGEQNDYRGKQYVGLQHAESFQLDNVADRFDTSIGRGDFKTQIGVGKVIKGRVCRCKRAVYSLTQRRLG